MWQTIRTHLYHTVARISNAVNEKSIAESLMDLRTMEVWRSNQPSPTRAQIATFMACRGLGIDLETYRKFQDKFVKDQQEPLRPGGIYK